MNERLITRKGQRNGRQHVYDRWTGRMEEGDVNALDGKVD